MTKLSLQESLVLNEARDPNLKYTEKKVKAEIERVTATLEGSKSSAMTRLAQRYHRLDLALKRMAEQRDKVNAEMKETVEGLFDSTDMIYTRVIETCSFVLTLNKMSKARDKVDVDYEAIITELTKLIPEELQPKVEEITKAFTTVTKVEPKSPSLKVEPRKPPVKKSVKEELSEGILDVFKVITKLVKDTVKSVARWAVGYDKKMSKLKKMAGIVNP